MPGDLASVVLASVLAEFVARYPAISLELDLSPRRVDLIGENFDVALRMGELRRRRVAGRAPTRDVVTASLYAAPDYLARRGAPAEPEALMEHDTLRLLARNGEPAPWIADARRAALGGHSAGPRHRQLTRAADPHGARRHRHRRW